MHRKQLCNGLKVATKRWRSGLVSIALAGGLVGLLGGRVDASHPAQVRDGRLEMATGSELWGFAWPDWPSIGRDHLAVRRFLKPMTMRGLNTLGFALQQPGQTRPFFLPDGRLADEARAAHFTQLTGDLRDLYLATVVELFSADPSCWLESADAYRQAVREVTGLLPKAHAVILVLGDLAGPQRWPNACPIDLNDPEVLVALCKEIHAVRGNVLVGVPARFIANAPEGDLLYVARDARALAAWIDAVARGVDPGTVTKDAAPLKAERYLRWTGEQPDAWRRRLDRFATDVQEHRLARDMVATQPAEVDTHSPAALSDAERAEGFELLFDGRSLDGWTTLDDDPAGWSVQDGVIHCKGVQGPWLRTRRRFGNFVLRLDFKISPKGNSGVFIRAPLDARASQFGMEMQILGVTGSVNRRDVTGAIYGVYAPSADVARPPGSWNEAEITCRGGRVRIRLNGQLVQDFDMDQVDELKERLRCGVVGLQDHGDEVWFRNIRIKTLEDVCRP